MYLHKGVTLKVAVLSTMVAWKLWGTNLRTQKPLERLSKHITCWPVHAHWPHVTLLFCLLGVLGYLILHVTTKEVVMLLTRHRNSRSKEVFVLLVTMKIVTVQGGVLVL